MCENVLNSMCFVVFLTENLSARKLRAEQDEPYGDITILPGHKYEEVHLA